MNVDGALWSPSGAVPTFLLPDRSESFFPRVEQRPRSVGAETPQCSQHKPRWPSPMTQLRRN